MRISHATRLNAAVALAGIVAAGCAVAESQPPTSRVRTYYVAADEVSWDYAPSGLDQVTGAPFGPVASVWTVRAPGQLGRVMKKALFREYTDNTFKALKPRAPEWEHLGMLGPLLRAEVGDTIRVVFRNNTRRLVSLHPHGVFYNKSSEGARYNDNTGDADRVDDGVPTGREHTYEWLVPERAGPTEHEGGSAFWMYHSHVSEESDINTGLIGPMIVTARGKAKADGAPTDIDREIIVAFAEMDENMSWLFDDNIDVSGEACASNFKETLNGFLFGNNPPITVRVGERVRWYLMGTTNFEVHAPHWHGNTVVINHMRSDVAALVTMGMVVADMVPDNPGKWLFHCHVINHLMAGMQTVYTVEEAAKRTTTESR